MSNDTLFEGWPEDEAPEFINIPAGALKWVLVEKEVSTSLGTTTTQVEMLDHSGLDVLRPGEQTRIGKMQLPHFLLAVLTGKRNLTPEALQFALELFGVSRSALADVIGVGRSTFSNFFSRGTVSKCFEHALVLALIEELRNPGFIASVREAQLKEEVTEGLALHLKLA